VPDLLAKIDGRTIKLVDHSIRLATKDALLIEIPLTKRQQFLAVVTNPNIAYLLMMLGTFGLIFEFTHPGIGFPGIAGLICLLLAMYAFQTLPISYAGVALVVVGLGLLLAEILIVSHGFLAVGGVIALALGSLMLFESPDPSLQVSLPVIASVVVTLSAIILFILQRTVRSHSKPVTTGEQGMVGQIGIVSTDLSPEGQIFVHGETWSARSTQTLPQGAKVRVKRVEGLLLVVEPVTSPPQ
jgi:membrane-bound serine protease (ClpP class)